MPADLLPWLVLAAQAGKPRLPDEVRDVVRHDHGVEAYRALELELLRVLQGEGGTARDGRAGRLTLRRFVTLAVFYEDRAADVRARAGISRALASSPAPVAADPAWIASQVQRADLIRDHLDLLSVSADCIGARAAWRMARAQCERGVRAPALCATAESGLGRLGDPMTTDQAAAQLEAAFDTGAPMGVCGTLSFEAGRSLHTQPDAEVAAAVLRLFEDGSTCSGARSW